MPPAGPTLVSVHVFPEKAELQATFVLGKVPSELVSKQFPNATVQLTPLTTALNVTEVPVAPLYPPVPPVTSVVAVLVEPKSAASDVLTEGATVSEAVALAVVPFTSVTVSV